MEHLLDFDDVLIEQNFSNISSRSQVNTTSCLGTKLPIINANMKDVASRRFLKSISEAGGVACSHRFQDREQQLEDIQSLKSGFATVGISDEELDNALYFYEHGVRNICIDVAHGAQKKVVDFINILKPKAKDSVIMVGNFGSHIAVSEFLYHLDSEDYIDFIKLGIGPSPVCRTRQVTGVGYPQISLIQETRRAILPKHKIVSDGGAKNYGDVCKALAAGADLVMTGSLFKNCIERESETYAGSASMKSYKEQGKDWQTAEGIVTETKELTDTVSNVMHELQGAIQSACSYTGSSDLVQFKTYSKFVRISPNTKRI